MKFKFEETQEDGTRTVKEFEATGLQDVFAEFRCFLLGCGFHISGDIDHHCGDDARGYDDDVKDETST